MIVKNFELKKYLNDDFNLYLMYGDNTGLIEDTIQKTFKPLYLENIYDYEELEIISNSEKFYSEIFNSSFFNKKKLIIINRVTEKIKVILENLINKKINDVKIILKSSLLDKKSKLRNTFEKNKNLLIIPFYRDTNQSLFNITEKFFKNKKISISSESIFFLLDKIGDNRLILLNELDKIYNYTKNSSTIKLHEIVKLINFNDENKNNEFVDFLLSKNKKKILNIFNEINFTIEDIIQVIRIISYKLKRLKKIAIELNLKKNYDQIISSFRPPIFWKDKENIKNHLKILSLKEINTYIKQLQDIELLIKKNSQLSKEIFGNFILEKF
jgi:DNA polymerase-3 subunit delta